jgi:hypothetical protein
MLDLKVDYSMTKKAVLEVARKSLQYGYQKSGSELSVKCSKCGAKVVEKAHYSRTDTAALRAAIERHCRLGDCT